MVLLNTTPVYLLLALRAGSTAVHAASIGETLFEIRDASVAQKTTDFWHQHMLEAKYPKNTDVCKKMGEKGTNMWDYSKAADYMTTWFGDNDTNLVDWPQQLHLNALSGSGVTPGNIDCTTLQSVTCLAPGDDDCKNYNPAAFVVIQTEIVNLYSALQAIGIQNLKAALMDSLDMGKLIRDFITDKVLEDEKEKAKKLHIAALFTFIFAGIMAIVSAGAAIVPILPITVGAVAGSAGIVGASAGAAGGISSAVGSALRIISAVSSPDGEVDLGRLQDDLNAKLGDYFDSMDQRNNDLAGKVFGTPKPSQDIDLKDFISAIDKTTDISNVKNDADALVALFGIPSLMNLTATQDQIKPVLQSGMGMAKLPLIGYLWVVRKFYVLEYTDVNQDNCKYDANAKKQNFDGASRWVAGVDGAKDSCFVLKIGDKKMDHDNNAPTELKVAEDEYKMDSGEMFLNVKACDNDKMLDDLSYSVTSFDFSNPSKCFYPLNYIQAESGTKIENDKYKDVAKKLGVKT
ncbi:Uu.00g115490.m01.CDS01 [Anthostomella pinea]|uniref:Uu.00g115490.m01.CDS01 n=1 Tax=Anthostomella pinea TaxID=933095 RepID=A0AAI8YGN1_9PEZI|nr:Uu.00g115490.m01.CDS01 [Anthostomella pinea]